ncbi:hypothetical protein J7T55_007442 [Diaporthe amygdali]|uniref:uncharacterized protein n=1 Tax=Phomopsis amygdali TaxID=1214568 RepID=UPI0022FE241D|nr:uncharacterized protein J7T55_007442 [Diaporthe amygdali]KAJ0116462.1 hypothetical protein J7T55_007442 [Diaporthe amygdali]
MKRSREPEEDDEPSSTTDQDVAIVPVSKFVGLDIDNTHHDPTPDIKCSLPGHGPGLSFDTYQDYESHYHKAHTNRCIDCRKNFPSSHILNLHIKEFHDALTELRKEKGDHVYSCFVETCVEKRKTPAERRAHLIETHKYPTNYFFAVTKAGVDHRQSMLVHRSESKPRANQRNNPRHQGQKEGKKHTKNAAPKTIGGSDVQSTASNDDGVNDSVAQPADVPMGGSDDPGPQDQTGYADTSSGNTIGISKGDDEEPPRRASISQSGQQAGDDREASFLQDTDMENLTGAMSSLRFVPRNIRLGSKKSNLSHR